MKANNFVGLLLFTFLSIPAHTDPSKILDLWGAPLGSDYNTCLSIWAKERRFPELTVDGPVFERRAEESLVFFRYQTYLNYVVHDLQAVFHQGLLQKVRMVFRKGQMQSGHFNSYFETYKRTFDKLYFPATRPLTFASQGAAWIFPNGQSIYMGSLQPSELVIILEVPLTSSRAETPAKL